MLQNIEDFLIIISKRTDLQGKILPNKLFILYLQNSDFMCKLLNINIC